MNKQRVSTLAQRHQQLIDEIQGKKEEEKDNSLRGKSLERAVQGKTPKTLTPWEWLEWYEEHGVPESHQSASGKPSKPWWRRWFWREGS